MPTLSEFEYGGSQSEIEVLFTVLSNGISSITDAINDISSIKTAVDANWAGKSKDKFLEALSTDVSNLDLVIQQLINALGNEFSNTMKVMQEHDLQMFQD